MRFLCLHGFGTNSSILETQLQAVAKELGSDNEYVFIDGEEEVVRARDLPASVPGPYLGYYSEYSPQQISAALDLIKAVAHEEGPFDAILGFSHGASLVISYLMQHEMDHPLGVPDFKFAVLFSPFSAVSSSSSLYTEILELFGPQETTLLEELLESWSSDAAKPITINTDSCRDWRVKTLLDSVLTTLQIGFMHGFISPNQLLSILATGNLSATPRVLVPALVKERIRIPVVHVIGARDEMMLKAQAESMKELCTPNLLHCVKHSLGHDIPKGHHEAAIVAREIEWAEEAARRNWLL